jgi:outer membrane lipoprotein-sorting protein
MKKSVYKDQRGIGQVVVILIVLVVIAAAGVVGWRVMQNNKTPAAAKTTAGKAVNSACLKVYSDKTLCNAEAVSSDFAKLAYTAVATTTDAQGQTSKITLQNDGKGNTSFTTDAAGQSFSTIEIGTTVYTKMTGSDTWTKYTSNAPTTTNPSSDLKTAFSDASTPAAKRIQYKNLGKDKCGSDTCYKYQVIDPALPSATNYVWFNSKTYQLQRLSTKDANGTTDFAITYTSVKITAPSPVTDAASASSAVPTQAEIQAAEQQAQAAAANQ